MAARRIKKHKRDGRPRGAGRETHRGGWESAARWLATGTLVAYSTAGGSKPALAQQQNGGSAGAPGQSQDLAVVQFDIPAGTLGEAMRAFEQVTGIAVSESQPGILDIGSPGVTGPNTPEMALRQLLTGTGVVHRFDGPARVTLEIRGTAFRVEVEDSIQEVTSPKYTAALRDIPQTITVIPSSVIQQQGATSLSEALRNVPGMTMTAGEGGTPAGDNLTLRGFNARNNMFVDGVRDLSPQSRDPFNLEQIEVTKGPNSGVYGRGSAGGTINLVSKSAGLTPALGGSFGFGNASQKRGTIDWNTPVPFLGERTGFRLNLLAHDAGVPGRNAVKINRWGMAPSLAFGLGTPTRLSLSYYKLKQDNISDYGIPWVPDDNELFPEARNLPAPVPRDTFYGYGDRDRAILNQDTGTVRVEHDFSDRYVLRSQLRYGRSGRNSMATPPRFGSTTEPIINREMRSWITDDRIWDNQTDLRADFFTGPIQHNMVTGAAFTRENQQRGIRTAPNSPTTLFNPNPDDVFTEPITISPDRAEVTGTTQALYAFDTARFGERWEASGGARWERFAVGGNGLSRNALVPVAQTTRMTSVRAGLVYKPIRAGSLYASYGTSLSPSLEGLTYQGENTDIPAEKTYTTEAGVKWDLAGSRVLLTGAVFRVAKDNARTPGILDTDPPQVLDGRQVTRGFELSASGAITSNIRILGGYTFVDAKIRESNRPEEVGKFFINTPRHSASVWVTYTAERFSFGLGPRAMSKRYGNRDNSRSVDGYFTLDAMASYTINDHWTLRLNLSNLNNEYYFERLGGGHVIPAPSRTALLTSSFNF